MAKTKRENKPPKIPGTIEHPRCLVVWKALESVSDLLTFFDSFPDWHGNCPVNRVTYLLYDKVSHINPYVVINIYYIR